jgi:glyoxylase-like metal-dependent hydrolase (beta-lactamase superfamily II)
MRGPRLKLAIVVLGAAVTALLALAASPASWPAQQAPGFYRLLLGDFRITVVSDGTAPRDLPRIMSKAAKVRDALSAAHETLPIELSINCFLIETGTKTIMIDTGAGNLFGANSGKLVANLRAAGYQPGDIDVILLTHIHGDHSGGLSIGGKRVFPNAVVYVDRRDPAYWFNATTQAYAPANRKLTFAQAHQTVDPYVRAGKLRPFDGATLLFPGIRSVPEYGHTPGHTGYMIESRGERLLLWGDIVHAAEVQFQDPTITIDYDVNPEEATASRQRAFAAAAERGHLVGGAHLGFPGLGHVRAEQTRFSWVPAPYSVILRSVPGSSGK